MALFVDFGQLYDDLQAAETDQERGATYVQHLFGALDSGYEPDQVDTDWYREQVAPEIETALGLDVPEPEILRYEDSDQLIYDVMTAMQTESGLAAAAAADIDDELPGSDDGLLTRLRKYATVEAEAGVTAKGMSILGEAMGGITDPYGDHLGPGTPPTETIAYTPKGIAGIADRYDVDTDTARDYIFTHEGIHTVQFDEYDTLLEMRRDGIRSMVDALMAPDGPSFDDAMDDVVLPMTLIEGHAEFYTNRLYPEFDRDEAEQEFDPLLELAIWYFGFDDKLEQYKQGEAFFETLHDRGGDRYVHYTMHNPPNSLDALEQPDRWADHVERQLDGGTTATLQDYLTRAVDRLVSR